MYIFLPEQAGIICVQEKFKGGQEIYADAPYEDIPIFVKAGSIIPCGPEIQYAAEKPAEPIRLFVFTGNDGSFTLYEDEDTNYNYEKGKYSTITFKYNEKGHVLTIGKQEGEFAGMLKTRTFEIIWVNKNKVAGMDFLTKPDIVVTYNGIQQSIKMKF